MNRKTAPASADITLREVWESAYNEIVEPDHFTVSTVYYITHWLPKLGGNGHLIVTVLRSLGYYNRKTRTKRDGIDIEQKELAKMCGLGLRTLQREFLENQTLARFVQREFETVRDRAGRIIREHYVYRIKMDDPLTDEDQAPNLEPIPSPFTCRGEGRKPGYVYLLEGGGFYKIGKAAELDRRIQQISPKLPFTCRLLHAIPSQDCLALEQGLHQRFSPQRVNGEWFQLKATQVCWFLAQHRLEAADLEAADLV